MFLVVWLESRSLGDSQVLKKLHWKKGSSPNMPSVKVGVVNKNEARSLGGEREVGPFRFISV